MAEIEAILQYYETSTSASVKGVTNANECTVATIPFQYYGKPVKRILRNAFSECPNLKTIRLRGNNLQVIESRAFSRCIMLNTVIFEDGSSINLTIQPDAFDACVGNVDPSGVVYLNNASGEPCICIRASDVFDNSSYTIPETVTIIAEEAFIHCKSLTTLYVGMKAGTIGAKAFFGCQNLKSVSFTAEQLSGNQMIAIEDNCFMNCTQLQSVILPNRLHTLGDAIFYGCHRLKYNSYKNINYLGNNQSDYILACGFSRKYKIDKAIFHPDCTHIANNAFYNCNLVDVTLPRNIYFVGTYAFANNTNLLSVFVPNSIAQYMRYGIFYNCDKAKIFCSYTSANSLWEDGWAGSAQIIYNYKPESIFELQYDQQRKSVNIKSIKANFSSNFIYYPAFINEYQVTSIGFNSDEVESSQGQLEITSIIDMQIAEGIEQIKFLAFNFPNLQKAYLPSTMIDIQGSFLSSPFYLCKKLSEIHFNNFSEDIAKINITAPLLMLESECVPFDKNGKITTVNISNIDNVLKNTFSYFTDIENVFLSDTVKSIGSYSFAFCTSIKSMFFPDSISQIDQQAFQGCSNLEQVVLSNNITTIPYRCFQDCSKLKAIRLPNLLKNIDSSAFINCSMLESLELPSSIEEIDKTAFSNCSNLKSIFILSDTVPNISGYGTELWQGINSNVKIYIPSNLEKQYKETPFWKTLANNFVVDDLKIMFARYARSQQQFQQLYSEYDDRNKSSIQEKLKRSIIDTIFPIGSLYITMNNLNPRNTLGGEWELLEGENTLWLTSGDKKLLSDDYIDLMPEASVQPGLPNILDEEMSPTLIAWDALKGFVYEIFPKAIEDNWSDIQLKGILSQWLIKTIAKTEIGGKPNSASGRLKFTTASLGSDFITNGLIGPIVDFLPETFTAANTLGIVKTFDASNCSPIYGNSDTVQPPAIRVYGWRRVG